MDSGKVAVECETHRRHAICSPDTAVFVSARFSRFVQNEVANIFPCENIHMRATFQRTGRKSYFTVMDSDVFEQNSTHLMSICHFLFNSVGNAALLCTPLNALRMFSQPRRSPTYSASAGDQGLRSRVSSCWSWSISSS